MNLDIVKNELQYYANLLDVDISRVLRAEYTEKRNVAIYNILRTICLSQHYHHCKDSSYLMICNASTSIPYHKRKRTMSYLPSCYNALHYYTDLLRVSNTKPKNKEHITCVRALNNIIHTMRVSRHNQICREDFSGLDFGNISLTGIHWSINGNFPCSFCNSSLNEWNFISGHYKKITSAAWSHDGKSILTGSFDQSIIAWDVHSHQMIMRMDGHKDRIRCVSISEDGRFYISGSNDKTAKIWDAELGQCVKTLTEHTSAVTAVAFSLDNMYCLTGSADGTAKIWERESGQCISTLKEHSGAVTVVVFSHNSRYCLTGSDDRTVKIWEREYGQCIMTLIGHNGIIRGIQFMSFDNDVLSYDNNGTIIKWHIDYQQKIHQIKYERHFKVNKEPDIETVVSSDGKYFFCSTSNTDAEIWFINSESYVGALKGTSKLITSIHFSLDRRNLLIGSWTGYPQIWNITTGKCQQNLDEKTEFIYSASFSIDNHYCITLPSDTTPKLWDVTTGQCFKIAASNKAGFLPFNKMYYVCIPNKAVEIWDAEFNAFHGSLGTKNDHICAVNYSFEKRICFTLSNEGKVIIWKDDRFECLGELEGTIDSIEHVAVSDSKLMIGMRDGVIRIWNIITRKHILDIDIHKDIDEYLNEIMSIGFLPDDNYCLIGCFDHAPILLNLSTLEHQAIGIPLSKDEYLTYLKERWSNESFKYCFPFIYLPIGNQVIVWKIEYHNTNCSIRRIAELCNVDGLFIKNCNFNRISATEKTKKIIYQYGGTLNEFEVK